MRLLLSWVRGSNNRDCGFAGGWDASLGLRGLVLCLRELLQLRRDSDTLPVLVLILVHDNLDRP